MFAHRFYPSVPLHRNLSMCLPSRGCCNYLLTNFSTLHRHSSMCVPYRGCCNCIPTHMSTPAQRSKHLVTTQGVLQLHSHKPPILHRDLKSPNMLVDRHWRVKVTDFNLSRMVKTGSTNASVTSMLANNPRWLAPEVISRTEQTRREKKGKKRQEKKRQEKTRQDKK